MLRVVLQDRHYENEALEVFQREYGIHFEMPLLIAGPCHNEGQRRERKGRNLGTGPDSPDRILDDRPLRPGTCPLFENMIFSLRVLQAGDETFLRHFMVGRKKKGKLVQFIDALSEKGAEIFCGCILYRYALSAACFSRADHRDISCSFLRVLRVSSFSTCLVNTPQQRNFTPEFINSNSTFSPS
jgi:hypothetical protein